VDVEDLGHERHVAVDLRGSGRVVARVVGGAPAVGDEVGVTLGARRAFGPDGRAV